MAAPPPSAMEAAVDGSGVLPAFDRKRIGHVLLETAMNRALELRCRRFHGNVGAD